MGRSKPQDKPFAIPKRLIVRAWKKVRVNGGAAGVDRVSVAEFETDLQNSLYKVWNRMSSGSYHPAAVLAVEIPKADGGVRRLGVPTVADRVAQTAVCLWLEERVEPVFHPDSYGYRPKRSALDAVAACQKRCWKQDWVIDLDIRAFFDSVRHDLLLRAVSHHCDDRWVLIYVQRWLVAPMSMSDGTLADRDRGTPQGAPVSPLLANLFMHYAFDRWLTRNHPGCPFERYADDAVIHCDNETQARDVLDALRQRLGSLGLDLHPDKTKIVYCKDTNRGGDYPTTAFDFLGYTFRGRQVKGKRGYFVGFTPAISDKARKRISKEIRDWHLKSRSQSTLADLATAINPQVRGWLNYYGAFHRSRLKPVLWRIDEHLVRWARHRHKRFRHNPARAWQWLQATREHHPALFTHWQTAGLSRSRPVGAV